MLSAIRKLFTFPETLDQEVASINDTYLNYPSDNPNFVTHPTRIINLLQQVMVLPPLCSAMLTNSKKIYLTSILDVQEEQGLIIFDKLIPADGNTYLVNSRELKIVTTLNGIPLTFSLKGIAVGKSEHNVFFKAYLPERIYYPQRRSSPRIATRSTEIGFQGTTEDRRMTFGGYVFDFSRNGIAINLYNHRGNINRGDTLTNCLIEFPDNQSLTFDLSIRSLKKYNLAQATKQIGGFVNNCTPQNQKRLERYMAALERAQIRKQKN
jgi:c-di-GMP-binding flagellar brake protein YcgR